MAAFRLAWEQGADGIEGDFRLTADGGIICMHDKSSKRTGGRDFSVAETALDRLQQLEVGSWKGEEFRGERPPTLEQVLSELPDGKVFFIELKSGREIMPALAKVIDPAIAREPGLVGHLSFISFDAAVVASCRKRWPQIKANWLVSFKQDKVTRVWSPARSVIISKLRASGATGVGVQAEPTQVDRELVREVRDTGLEFHCWTVNEVELARRFEDLGADSITTDLPLTLGRGLRSAAEAGGGGSGGG